MRKRVLADRNMRVLFAGQSMNMLGNSAMIIVLGIWVKDLTGSSGAAGLVFVLLGVTSFLAPVTGLIVDKFPRRPVLIINDSLTGLAIALLLLVHGRSGVWLIYAVAGVYGLSGQVYRAARGGLIHSILPGELLGDANGLLSSLNQAMRIVGPLAGAGVYAAWGGGVVAVADIGTFAISVASYAALRKVPDLARSAPETAARRTPAEFARDLAAGLRHVRSNPVIRRIVLASSVAFTGAGMVNVAVFSLVSQGMHRPTSLLGLLTGIEGAGSVIASLCVGPMMRKTGEFSAACLGYVLNGVGLAVSATATLAGAAAGMFLLGFGLPLIMVAEITIVQRRTPAELQGRVISASDAIITTPFMIATAVAAAIIDAVGFRPIYIGVAIGFVAVGLYLLPYLGETRPQVLAQADGHPVEAA
ncbi:MAG TPA: MFS transporter [Streptosporangiaceae bacterium]|nr:MFS transporter [Streptosporangiaceae bacterium]